MFIKKLFLSVALLTTASYANNSIAININNDDLEVAASLGLNTLTDYANGTQYLLDMNYLHTDGNNLSEIGFFGQNTLQGKEGLTLAFGLKAVIADDFLAFPLAVKGVYKLPLLSSIPTTSLMLSYAYAPSVLSFRDADNFSEFRLELDMEVISNIHVFTGYRTIDTDYETHNHVFNNSFYGGLKIRF